MFVLSPNFDVWTRMPICCLETSQIFLWLKLETRQIGTHGLFVEVCGYKRCVIRKFTSMVKDGKAD